MKTISPGFPLAPTVETTVAFGLYPGPPVIPIAAAEVVAAEPDTEEAEEAEEPPLEAEEAGAAVVVAAVVACCLWWMAIGGIRRGTCGAGGKWMGGEGDFDEVLG